MKERPVDLQRTVIAHNKSAKVPQPRERAFDRPASRLYPLDRDRYTYSISRHDVGRRVLTGPPEPGSDNRRALPE
jgi:hypothetical protein